MPDPTRYRIGPFEFDTSNGDLSSGGLEGSKPLPWIEQQILRVLVANPDGISKEDLLLAVRPSKNYNNHNLQSHITNLRKKIPGQLPDALGMWAPYKLLGVIPIVETRITQNDSTGPLAQPITGVPDTTAMSPSQTLKQRPLSVLVPTRPDIKQFASSHPQYGLYAIDEYLQIYAFSNGLSHNEVILKSLGTYEPPPFLQDLIDTLNREETDNAYYSFSGWEIPFDDEASKDNPVVLYTRDGYWHHLSAINKVWAVLNNPSLENKPGYPAYKLSEHLREVFLENLFPLHQSPLYRQMNCEVILVTADQKIVIARRAASPFSAGKWTASLEEQVLRRRAADGLSDYHDLWRCVQRGTQDELGIGLALENIKLVSFGIEWGNFTAACLFVAESSESFGEICESWRSVKGQEVNEAVVLDCRNADPQEIATLLKSDQYMPTEKAVVGPWWQGNDDPRVPSVWHPIAKARLFAYLRYNERRTRTR